MKLDIIVNKYLIIWHLLYTSSINEDIHKLKQKLFLKYKKQYMDVYKEKELILKNLDDYIPDDDIIYDNIETSFAYKKIKAETNRYRLNIMEIWDKNKNQYLRELNKLLKYEFNTKYTLCVVHPSLNMAEVDYKNKVITIGKKLSVKDQEDFFTYLIYKILKYDFLNIKKEEKNIVATIIELLVTNELYTRLTKESKYSLGKNELKEVKKYIYPYWLMYLGVDKEDFEKYMVRDNIYFNPDSYSYNDNLQKLDIMSFISYIIRNKTEVFKVNVEKNIIQ